mgnify:CR=1 FL=1
MDEMERWKVFKDYDGEMKATEHRSTVSLKYKVMESPTAEEAVAAYTTRVGWYRYNSVPSGRVSFAWGARGFAYRREDGVMFARIWKSGDHPTQNHSGIVVEGEWSPDNKELLNLNPILEIPETAQKTRDWAQQLDLPTK